MRTIRRPGARPLWVWCAITVLVWMTAAAATPGPAKELFGYKLDIGTGSAASFLGQRGYKVTFREDRTFPRTSFAEVLHFTDERFDDAHLSAHAWNYRVYLYRWEDHLLAEPKEAALVERLILEISKTFGEPEVVAPAQGGRPAVDEALLAAVADGEGDKGLHLIWTGGDACVELRLSTPLLPDKVARADLSVRYLLPKVEEEVLAYLRGDSGNTAPKP